MDNETPYTTFLSRFTANLKLLFREKYNVNEFSRQHDLPPGLMSEILYLKPLSVAVPKQFGGRGTNVKECLGVLSAASYESLPLSLLFGINIALFLEPLAKYGNSNLQGSIFRQILEQNSMGGLMITEPDFGSDALNLKTFNVKTETGYRIKGTKHWQGLSGMANFWLIATRCKNTEGRLERDIDFFICDTSIENQKISVEEYFDTPGLSMIPYGRNAVDIQVPETAKLIPTSTGIKLMLDVLHRSRMQFPGMGMGFIQRMLDEALEHCRNRIVGLNNLLHMDNVQFQIAKLQAAFTICSAMCVRSSKISGISNDLSAQGFEANCMKAVVTDLMNESANTLVQLSGARGYRVSHIGGRGIMDSRPFQIFEGANEMLYAQVSEMILRLMKKKLENSLFGFLKNFSLTDKSSGYLKKELSFTLSLPLSQRRLCELGKAISRLVSMNYVLDLSGFGFSNELSDNCIEIFKQEVASILCSFRAGNRAHIVDEYRNASNWLNFA